MKTIGASSTVAPTLPLLVKSSPPFPLRPIELLPRPESQRRPSQRIFLPVADSPRPISSIRLPIPFPLHGSLFVWRQLGAQPTGEPWWSWSWPTETASKGKNPSLAIAAVHFWTATSHFHGVLLFSIDDKNCYFDIPDIFDIF